jgi:hypothetical protein
MMADNYKILGQATAASIELISGENQAETLYTVPENTQAAISSISLVNTAEENVEYSLGVVKAENVSVSADITLSNQKFIALSSTSYPDLYSTDGVAWTEFNMSGPGSISWRSVTHGNDKFVAVAEGSSSSAHSTDGITWTQSTLPFYGYWWSVTYGNGKFVTVSAYPTTAAYSTDGIAWTQTTTTATHWRSVTYGGGKFVAVGDSSAATYSTDGITWTETMLPMGISMFWTSVAFGDGKFVAVSYNGDRSAHSTDGITWTQAIMPSFALWNSVAYGNGSFVATSNYQIARSTNGGANWNATLSSSGNFTSVTYGNDKFVAVTRYSGFAAYSTDGATWTTMSLPRSGNRVSVNFVGSPGFSKKKILSSQTIIPTRPIEPNVVDEIVGGITLSAGDQIRIYSESPDLIAQVYGVEIE